MTAYLQMINDMIVIQDGKLQILNCVALIVGRQPSVPSSRSQLRIFGVNCSNLKPHTMFGAPSKKRFENVTV
jgi:hypothetical protein